jgi:hypothetical protein
MESEMITNKKNDQGDGNSNNNDEEVSPPSLFDDLLPDIRAEIYSHCLPTTLGLFARTSRQAAQETAFLRLLSCMVEAEPESYKQTDKQTDETRLAAIAILKRYPELLFRKGTVTDHVGRKIKASPYRVFLGAGDIWALKQVHEEILPNIEDGEAKAKDQFQAQFPNCPWPFNPKLGEEQLYDNRNKKQIEQVIAQLETIVEKITADPCINSLATLDETTKAVSDLRKIFEPKEGEVIQTGLHFPLGIMREIYKVYHDQEWNEAQYAFFSREVIGAVLSASTAVDGQCCKYGLHNLDKKKGPDRRDGLFCRHPKGIPQELAPLKGKLGKTVFVDLYDGESCFLTSVPGVFNWYSKNTCVVRLNGAWFSMGVRWVIGEFMQEKAETYGSYYAATEEKSPHRLYAHD